MTIKVQVGVVCYLIIMNFIVCVKYFDYANCQIYPMGCKA